MTDYFVMWMFSALAALAGVVCKALSKRRKGTARFHLEEASMALIVIGVSVCAAAAFLKATGT